MDTLDKEFVIDIHNNIIKEFGGLKGIKDIGALDSSLNNAFATFFGEDLYKTDVNKISNIFYLLNKNHCFVDANKRTSVVVFNILVKMNNINIKYKLKELEELSLNISNDIVDIPYVNKWIEDRIVR